MRGLLSDLFMFRWRWRSCLRNEVVSTAYFEYWVNYSLMCCISIILSKLWKAVASWQKHWHPLSVRFQKQLTSKCKTTVSIIIFWISQCSKAPLDIWVQTIARHEQHCHTNKRLSTSPYRTKWSAPDLSRKRRTFRQDDGMGKFVVQSLWQTNELRRTDIAMCSSIRNWNKADRQAIEKKSVLLVTNQNNHVKFWKWRSIACKLRIAQSTADKAQSQKLHMVI